ncbi:c-type cytochrome [Falsiroseomonas sp. HW251]|uniref:c-type cytochrome n=1 Tax=Falsiroseomonas sp. HW251 TaxID=3390998 RepID=UPI003D318034
MAVAASALAQGDDGPPAWAYAVNPPAFSPPPDDGIPRRVPGSAAAFTLTQTRNLFFAPDWHPDDHPPMPDIVSQGRRPAVMACGSCHRADGSGGPENAGLAGLPIEYFRQQIAEFRSGARGTSVPGRAPTQLMIATARSMTSEEVEAAAAYFAAIRPRAAIRVVEAEQVPSTQVTGWYLVPQGGGGTEPIGRRVIEVPEDPDSFALRDGRARFVAYAPPGSLERGRVLATTDAGDAVQCSACHGPALRGVGAVPGIAGRSPSYMVRQFYDYRTGARAGADSAPMRSVVESLSPDDLVAVAAYAASLTP